MTSGNDPLAFTRRMPGVDFMRQFTQAAADKNAMPNLAGWVMPTVSVQELDKRITDLKTVQFWLEQNLHVLRATVQALEVQKMTLAALQGMNLNLADIAKAFAAPSRPAGAGAAQPSAEADGGAADGAEAAQPAPSAAEQQAAGASAGVDPLQWWGALTRQFQSIAADALREAGRTAPPAAAGAADAAPTAQTVRRSTAKSAAKPTTKPTATRSAQKKSAKPAARRGTA